MRRDYPSRGWRRRFQAEFVAAGGHNGPATLNAALLVAEIAYRLGATPAAAAYYAAREYSLRSRLQTAEELAAHTGQWAAPGYEVTFPKEASCG